MDKKNGVSLEDMQKAIEEGATESARPMPVVARTCADCKYVKTHKRPKIMSETGFGDQLMFDDVDETVYACNAPYAPGQMTGGLMLEGVPGGMHLAVLGEPGCSEHAGKEIGPEPITCKAWAAGAKAGAARLAELDAMIAAREARTRDKA
jgi:hypothetical protein